MGSPCEDTDIERSHMVTEAEIGGMSLETQACQVSVATRSWKRSVEQVLSLRLHGDMTLPTP